MWPKKRRDAAGEWQSNCNAKSCGLLRTAKFRGKVMIAVLDDGIAAINSVKYNG